MDTSIRGIFGRKGTGKSTLLAGMVRSEERVILVDPMGEHGELGVVVRSMASFKRYWKKSYKGKWRIVLQPHVLDPSKPPREALAPYLELIQRAAREGPPFVLVVDEVDVFGDSLHEDPALALVANYGRHFGISLIFAARRPRAVPRTLTSQADELWLYQTTEPVDIDYLRAFIGREAAARLPILPRHVVLRWSAGGDVALHQVTASGELTEFAGTFVETPAVERSGETVILTLGELAARYGFSNPQKFRAAVIEGGRLEVRRLSRSRWEVCVDDLPVK